MHINARDIPPSKAFCFIIEYTPYMSWELIKGMFLRWFSFIAVRAKLDYAFRYGCLCGTAAVPILLAFFDVVFEPTTENRYRFTMREHATFDTLFFVYVGLAFGSGTFIEHL